MSSDFQPLGYSKTWFQLMMASLSVAEDPAENPPSKVAGERKSSSAVISVVPEGTSTWRVNPSFRSRRHFRDLPAAENFSPERSMTGPSGACSPGIHLG